jgi:hypothetical protein
VTRLRGATTAAAWVLVTAVSLAGAVLTVMAWSHLVTSDTVANLTQAPSAVLYATLGALIVRRAGNVIGWFLLGIGAGLAVNASASAYAVLGITHPGTLPAPELVGLLAEWSFVPLFSAIVFMLVLFPPGTLPSPRWRPFAALALLATALAMAGFVVHPRLVALPAPDGVSLTFANPLGIDSLGPVLSTVLPGTLNSLGVVGTVLLAGAFVSLAVRYRSGGRDRRRLRRDRGKRRHPRSRRPLGDLVRTLPDGQPRARAGRHGDGRPAQAGQGRYRPLTQAQRAVRGAGRADPPADEPRAGDLAPGRRGTGARPPQVGRVGGRGGGVESVASKHPRRLPGAEARSDRGMGTRVPDLRPAAPTGGERTIRGCGTTVVLTTSVSGRVLARRGWAEAVSPAPGPGSQGLRAELNMRLYSSTARIAQPVEATVSTRTSPPAAASGTR